MQRLRPSADDRGAALIMVVLLGFVSILLVGTGLTVATSGLRQASSTQQSASALDAAFAGVQDYVARINADDAYVTKYANLASSFTLGSGSKGTDGVDPQNPAFGTGVSGAGASTGAAKYRYEVDNSAYKTTGVVRLRATGVAGNRARSLLVSLRVRGFVDYSYFTDYEIQDPQISGAPVATCEKHVWEGRPVDCGGVRDIVFGSSDAVSGDVHSNDRMVICGATFTGRLTTAYSGSPLYSTRNCTTVKTISNITHADALPMPSTNSTMETDAACLYTGPTQITYNSDGTMTVVSPWTKYTAVKNNVGSNPGACGSPAQLATPGGARVGQLDADLLYVQNVPSVDTDPNYRSTASTPPGVRCVDANGALTSATDGIGWSLTSAGATNPSIRYPGSNEAPATTKFGVIDPSWNTTLPAYGCRNGDLYVEGTVTKQTTAASENYVYVTDDLLYADRTTDVLGLVGQNAVFVWNPMTKITDRPMLNDSGREIDAAVVSVAHTFQVQNYDRGGTRGALTVFGSIAQKYRGPVAASFPDTGYTKSYAYDPLLKTVSPPKFLASTATSFTVTRYAAVPSAYTPAGAPAS
jgi:hypothetical protein